MKIWYGYGSEHSMNLIIIGRFESIAKVKLAVERIEALSRLAQSEIPEIDWNPGQERISERFLDAMRELGIYDMSHEQVDDFAYEYRIQQTQDELRIWTDESDIEGFLKVLLHFGAKIEVFSLHEWRDDGTPRLDDASVANDYGD